MHQVIIKLSQQTHRIREHGVRVRAECQKNTRLEYNAVDPRVHVGPRRQDNDKHDNKLAVENKEPCHHSADYATDVFHKPA